MNEPIFLSKYPKEMINDFEVCIIRSLEEFDAMTLEWREFLEKRVGECRFRQDPAVMRVQFSKHPERYEPRIIVLLQNKQIQCIAPCYIDKTKFQLHLSVISLPSPRVSLLKICGDNLIVAEGIDVATCIDRVLDILEQYKLGFDLIFFQSTIISGPLWNCLQTRYVRRTGYFRMVNISPKQTEKVRRHILAASYEEWLGSLRSKTRGKMLRMVRKFKEYASGSLELVKVTRSEQVQQFLDRLDVLYPLTWQARTLTMKKRNTPEEIERFQEIAAHGWLRSYMLICYEKPVAFLIGFQYAGIYEYVEIGYDPEFSSFEPGSVLNQLMLEDIYNDNPPKILDFGFGENIYKMVLGNDEQDVCSIYLVPANHWRLLIALQQFLNLFYRRIRTWLINTKLDRIVRHILKRKV